MYPATKLVIKIYLNTCFDSEKYQAISQKFIEYA